MITTLLQDIRFSLRILRRNAGFSLVAILSLGLGIGAATGIFSLVSAVLLSELPYQQPDSLVTVWQRPPGGGTNVVSGPAFLRWRESNDVFEEMAAVGYQSYNLAGEGEPENVTGGAVSAGFFEMLGVRPVLGRTITSGEDRPGAPHVAVIGYPLWQRRWGGDPGVIGKSINLNGDSYTVVGVMPRGFQFMVNQVELWVPLALDPVKANPRFHYLLVSARMKQGVTTERAQAAMDSLAARIGQELPETDWGAAIVPLRKAIVGSSNTTLLVLLGAVGFLLLIACANVANLVLSRAVARQKELGVRMALGADRRRIVAQLLTESLMLGILGGAVGLLAALWGVGLLSTLAPDGIRPGAVRISWVVLGFSIGLSVLSGVASGMLPALSITETSFIASLGSGGGRSGVGGGSRLRGWFVAAEVALAMTLLAGAGLMVRNLYSLQFSERGFNESNLLTLTIQLPRAKSTDPARISAFYDSVLERIKTIPGVVSGAATTSLPVGQWTNGRAFTVLDSPAMDPTEVHAAGYLTVSSNYTETAGIRLVEGRGLSEQDRQGTPPVVLISQHFAKAFFPNTDPIGKRIKMASQTLDHPGLGDPITREIVGVVSDVQRPEVGDDASVEVYVPYSQFPVGFTHLVVRTESDPARFAPSICDAIRSVDADQPVSEVRTMDQVVADLLSQPRISMWLLLGFALAAATLAAVGIYAVTSQSVAQRTGEIGVRMALGADRKSILAMVIGQSMKWILAGTFVGLAGALALTRLVSSLIFGIGRPEPITFFGVSMILVFIALAACYVPARRASKLDPLAALRLE